MAERQLPKLNVAGSIPVSRSTSGRLTRTLSLKSKDQRRAVELSRESLGEEQVFRSEGVAICARHSNPARVVLLLNQAYGLATPKEIAKWIQ